MPFNTVDAVTGTRWVEVGVFVVNVVVVVSMERNVKKKHLSMLQKNVNIKHLQMRYQNACLNLCLAIIMTQ